MVSRDVVEPAGNLRLCLAGAAPDTGNLGVQALYASILAALGGSPEVGHVSVLDNGWGVRQHRHQHGAFQLEHCGARMSRRWHRTDTWANIAASARLGGIGNPIARRIREADAVLDISGGDSFSDNYTAWTFRRSVAPKRLALALRRPLILLPQTYGPFRDPAARAEASRIVRAATLAYSRDAASHEVLVELRGGHDGHRLVAGVDMAFALRPADPGPALPGPVRDLLSESDRSRPLVGVNVNGLLYSDRYAAERFGIRFDYRTLVQRLLTWLVAQDCDVLLVPHVAVVGGKTNPNEDDVRACRNIVTGMGAAVRERVHVVPAGMTAAQIKWAIARTDWFCGSRMHSTIGSMSSGVPTAAVAYSMKMRGVFETCGIADEVIDGRSVNGDECLLLLKDAWVRREAVRRTLSRMVESVRTQANRQLDLALEEIAGKGMGMVS